jgi:hypothetical protein
MTYRMSGTAEGRSMSLSGGDKTQRGRETTIRFIAMGSAGNVGCGQFYTV